jgi:uncharacterized membrane protein YtjA (UPF0391 family)
VVQYAMLPFVVALISGFVGFAGLAGVFSELTSGASGS